MMRLLCLLLLCCVLSAPALAVQPDEIMKDPVLEARARAISKQLRCLVCQGEDIDESNAGLARDLRILVRERLAAGDTDAAVMDYIAARYGDYVLMRPPVKPSTFLLWLTPLAALLGGGYCVFRRLRPAVRR